jgi:hypothetical protein
MRDPDGYLIEVGQSTDLLRGCKLMHCSSVFVGPSLL